MKPMRRPLRRVSLAVLLLLGLLLVNLNYLQALRAEELNNRPGNARVLLREYGRQRGPILVDRTPVALSRATDDTLKYLRTYPGGPLYAHSTGYYSLVYGAEAVEKAENEVLSGRDERFVVRQAVDLLTGGDETQQSGSVALTLNPRAQRAAAEGLGNRRGAVVALDPATGAILAMVSSPSYDPDALASHDADVVRRNWERLNDDPAQPLLNRAIRKTYPPGSTFKVITSAAALSTGRYAPDTKIPGPARIRLPLTRIDLPNFDNAPCETSGSSTTTLENALKRSCNTGFASVGLQIGDDAMREQAEKFGFGREVSLPVPAAVSVFPEEVNRPQTALSAIGQYDVRATPLQMAMMTAGIANRGVVMTPYLVDEVLGPDLSVMDKTRPRELSRAVSPQVSAQVTQMMATVVREGTGRNGQIPGMTVAGKTGTAQQGEGKPPHAWYVSFAPAETARVAVAVVIEDGGGEREVSGNRLAAPIAREVMRAVLER